MPKTEDQSPVVVGRTYDFVMWLLPKVEGFPRSYRFTVGERLSASGLDLLTLLVEASYARNKAGLLDEASRKVNAIRYLLRLAKDLRMLPVDGYGFSAGLLDEIGRMVGGWSKATAGGSGA